MRHGSDSCVVGLRTQAICRRAGTRSENTEPRPGAERTVDFGPEQPREPRDDRQPEAQSEAAIARDVADLIELLEDLALLVGRDADAAVAHFDLHAAPRRRQQSMHRCPRRV